MSGGFPYSSLHRKIDVQDPLFVGCANGVAIINIVDREAVAGDFRSRSGVNPVQHQTVCKKVVAVGLQVTAQGQHRLGLKPQRNALALRTIARVGSHHDRGLLDGVGIVGQGVRLDFQLGQAVAVVVQCGVDFVVAAS